MASEKGYHEIIKLMIDWKPKLSTVRASNEDLPFHRAAAFGQLCAVKELCNSDVINLSGADGKTALHYAIIDGHFSVVEYLLNRGANVNACGQAHECSKSPLIVAMEVENYEIIETLLDFDANVESQDEDGWRPIHFAAFRGRTTLARRLLNMGCESEPLTNEGATPLFLALSENHIKVINLLWTRTQDKTSQLSHSGATYAHLAARRGRSELIRELLKMDSRSFEKKDIDGDDPLMLAALFGKSKVVDLLVASRKDWSECNAIHGTVLVRAVRSGRRKTVRILLSKGTKVNARADFMRTALSWAVDLGLPKMTQDLLKAGANPFERDAMVCARQGSSLSHLGHHFPDLFDDSHLLLFRCDLPQQNIHTADQFYRVSRPLILLPANHT